MTDRVSFCTTAGFDDFHTTHVRACTRLARVFYRRLAQQHAISEDDYGDMVCSAVTDAFSTVWRRGTTAGDRPLALLVVCARRRLKRLLDEVIRHLARRADLEAAETTRAVTPDLTVPTAVHQVLEQLPVRQAQALRARYLENRPLQEVATVMEVTDAAANSLLQRGRQEFRTLWTQQGGSL